MDYDLMYPFRTEGCLTRSREAGVDSVFIATLPIRGEAVRFEAVGELSVEGRYRFVSVRGGDGGDRRISEAGEGFGPDFQHTLPRAVIDDAHAREGNEARTVVASRCPVSLYRLCSTYAISKMTDCGMMPAISPSSAAERSARAAECCAAFRSTKNETKTFASTTLRTSDASSGLPSLSDRRQCVGAVLDEAFQLVERGPLCRDRDSAAADFPSQFVAGIDIEHIPDLFRNRCLPFAGDG
jgi:hypothetical protein